MHHIIGLVGRAGSGKTTLAHALLRRLPRYREANFAGALKDLCIELFGLNHDHCYGESKLREIPIPGSANRDFFVRADMAFWSLNYMIREMFPERAFWQVEDRFHEVLAMLESEAAAVGHLTPRRILELVGTEWGRHCDPQVWVREFCKTLQGPVVVGDMRFPTGEGDYVSAAGGNIFYLDAGDRLPPRKPDAHASEPTWEAWSSVAEWLDTSGTLDPPALAELVIRKVSANRLFNSSF